MSQGRPSYLHFLSFIPALAYWWLEETQPLHIALSVGIGLSILEVTVEKLVTGKVHTLSRLNFGIIMILGGLSLFAREGVWFKLQPTLTGVVCGTWLTFNQARGKTMFLEMMQEMGRPWPFPHEWLRDFERHVIVFIFAFATFMAYWSIWGTTAQWAFWKTGGQYLSFGTFMVIEFWWFRRKVKRMKS
jgi:intracellular septation protein